MLNENTVAKILEYGLQQGADFTEVFIEDSVASSINLLDQKIEEINSSNSFGIGVRLLSVSYTHLTLPTPPYV